MSEKKTLLSIDNLSVETTMESKTLVNGVSFHILEGESVGIVGESGSGKTLTALSILGLLPRGVQQKSGKVIFRDTQLSSSDEESMRKIRGDRISMIYQDPMTSLNPMMKIGKQIQEVLRAHDKPDDESIVISALASVSIPDPEKCFSSYPHEFSGGMRQRVMIAMALLLKPDLLIADEPTTALDVTVQRQILNLVTDLKASHRMSILWISHDLSVIAEMVDKIIVMYAGRVVEVGSVQKIFEQPQHPYTVGLISSLVMRKHQESMVSIPGTPPKPWVVTEQCGFVDRCSKVIPACRTSLPELAMSNEGGFACFNPESRKLL